MVRCHHLFVVSERQHHIFELDIPKAGRAPQEILLQVGRDVVRVCLAARSVKQPPGFVGIGIDAPRRIHILRGELVQRSEKKPEDRQND